jgi:hypothetical protein
MSSEDLKLPASLQKLYDALQPAEDSRSVLELHEAVHGPLVTAQVNEVRHMQQRLGSYVTKLNRRLKGHKLAVKPGDRKYTYVLTSL